MLYIVGFVVSLIPNLALFFWLRSLEGDEGFKGICNKALTQGMFCTLPVLGCSLVLFLLEFALSRIGFSGIPKAAYHSFFVLAFSEELVKYLWFRKTLKQFNRAWSWMDYIILMSIVGLGFGLLENVAVAIGSNIIVMLIRGLTMGHAGYGFIMGYFMGKAEKTGNRLWSVIGFVLPWILHGLYDFGLSNELLALGDYTAILAVGLAAVSAITIIVLIVFMLRKRRDKKFLEPLHPTAALEREHDQPAPIEAPDRQPKHFQP